jgi:uncharacterized protein (TIGR02284 family)
MEKQHLENLKSLHTSEINARNGYEEAIGASDASSLTPLFSDMVGVHELNAQEIAAVLTGLSEEVDSDGTLMSVIHRTIIEVRSIFNGLGESMLPSLIDGEKRNVELYDEALKADAVPPAIEKMLTDQRGRIQDRIDAMEARWAAAA